MIDSDLLVWYLTGMSETLKRVKALVAKGEVRISDHGYDELAADNLTARHVVSGLTDAEGLEDYPNFPKGPCVLVLEGDQDGRPIHAVWGIPRGKASPAVLVTAYRPDPSRWTDDYRSRNR